MDLDVGAYGSWLLDWLYDQPMTHRVAEREEARLAAIEEARTMEEAQAVRDQLPSIFEGSDDTAPFFAHLGLPGIAGYPIDALMSCQGALTIR